MTISRFKTTWLQSLCELRAEPAEIRKTTESAARDIGGGIQFFPWHNETLRDFGKNIQNTNL
jgi:hypothetical protein